MTEKIRAICRRPFHSLSSRKHSSLNCHPRPVPFIPVLRERRGERGDPEPTLTHPQASQALALALLPLQLLLCSISFVSFPTTLSSAGPVRGPCPRTQGHLLLLPKLLSPAAPTAQASAASLAASSSPHLISLPLTVC